MSLLRSLAVVAVCFAVFSGCAAFEGIGTDITPPTLIQKIPFPQLPRTVASNDFYLKMHLIISDQGLVKQVTLDNSSGDEAWDSEALKCVMQWKYSPGLSDNKPIQMKIEQSAHVVYVPPLMMEVSEILCASGSDAKSVYSSLKAGAKFDSLAGKYSISASAKEGGSLGKVDINRFPDEVLSAVKRLSPGEFTEPIQVGSYFMIVKRDIPEKAPPEASK